MNVNLRVVRGGDYSPEQLLVMHVREALHRDGASPGGLFELLERLLVEDTWRRVEDGKFGDFVRHCLDTTPELLRRVIELPHPQEDTPAWRDRAPRVRQAVLRLLTEDVEEERGPGRPPKENLRDTKVLPESDTVERTVARLKRDARTDSKAAELLPKVLADEIKPNAAARQMGWRKPRVVLTSPQAVARKIREHFTPEQIAQLVKLLLAGEDS